MQHPASSLVDTVARIGAEVAAPAAPDVDAKARFPREAIDALNARMKS